MTTSAVASTATPQITFPIEATAGSITIAVHKIPGGYSLLVTALGTTYDNWCGGFTNVKTALAEASRVLAAFRRHGGPDQVEAHANALGIQLAAEQARPARMQDNARIGNLYTELAALEDLTTARNRAALTAQFAQAA